MSTYRLRRQPQGFTLLHMVVAIAILGVFIVVASQLTMQCMHLWDTLATRQESITRLEGVLRRLQRDVWSAHAITTPTPHRLILKQPGGRTITWIAGADEPTLRRQERRGAGDFDGSHAAPDPIGVTWRFSGHEPFTFNADDASARLRSGNTTATLISQMRLAQGESP